MTELATRSPAFTTALRGYDRAQVDDYIDRLQRRLAAMEDRARAAEAEFVFEEHAAVGPRVTEIFALAEAEARDLRDEVSMKADRLLEAARAEAHELVEAAEKQAETVTERAERDHVVMFAELEQERERIRAEVAALERRKAEAIGELHRLRELLGDAAGLAERAVEGNAVAAAAAPAADLDGRAKPSKQAAELNGRAQLPTEAIGAGDETVELPALTADLDET